MNFVLHDCRIINEGRELEGDVRVRGGKIAKIGGALSAKSGEKSINARGMLLFPGLIDDQVHFREPGLTHKGDIASESRAAAAGGITSYMEMPNVLPPTLDIKKIRQKRAIAAKSSRVNYAFHLGASAGNIADIAAAPPGLIAGVKVFMGSTTGNLLVDDDKTLAAVFRAAPGVISVHCESSPKIKKNLARAKRKYGGAIPPEAHPKIRNTAACYESTSRAVAVASETGARLHVLHISTARELEIFSPGPPAEKQITCEACAHHLLFDDSDYGALGMRLKTNPAVKTAADKRALRRAVAGGLIDVLATDHAPHLLAEKEQPYEESAAGMPLAEYALPAFLELVADGVLDYSDVAARGSHAPADIFAVKKRGYIREGYWADLVLVEEADSPARKKVLSKCGWTPFAGRKFRHAVRSVFVNGEPVFDGKAVDDSVRGKALEFAR